MTNLYNKVLNFAAKKIKSYSLPAISTVTHGDFTLRLKPRYDNIQRDLFLGKGHENHVRLFLEKHVKPGMVYFDIGAHVGVFTLLASKLAGEKGQCVAFEPCSALADILDHNLRFNNVRNVKAIRMAVTDKNSDITFYRNRDLAMSSVIYFPTYNKEKVRSISLDTFCSRENIFPDFIKIDAEGAEVSIFKGMQNLLESRKKPIILCELHAPPDKNPDRDISGVPEFFKSHQYEIYTLNDSGDTMHMAAMPADII